MLEREKEKERNIKIMIPSVKYQRTSFLLSVRPIIFVWRLVPYTDIREKKNAEHASLNRQPYVLVSWPKHTDADHKMVH